MTDDAGSTKRILRFYLALVAVALVIASIAFRNHTSSAVAPIWILGAAALGLVSGFTTGASEQTGAGTEFLKFLSAGILVPLLGGVVSYLRPTATSTAAAGPVTGPPAPDIHPLWVVGAFFLGYGLGAVFGIVLGIMLRTEGNVAIKVKA